MNNDFVLCEYPFGSTSMNVQFTTDGMCANTYTKERRANKRGVGRHPKKLAVSKQLQTCVNAKREKVWERRFNALPCHFTPAYTHDVLRAQAKTYTHIHVMPGRIQGGAIAPLKPMKVTLFIMILYNSENNIRD